MTSAFLVVGATGNTGKAVVATLSELVKASPTFSNHKILAMTRSASGAAAQKLAALPGVEVVEYSWVSITADWLRQHNVVRAFIASHNEPTQFAEESTFHVAALKAGVEAHWAIEALLGSPEFKRLRWTSLQANFFTAFYLQTAAALVNEFRETGKQSPLRLIGAEDVPVGAVHADDVGEFAARLLVLDDVAPHNGQKYVLNGPEDITGRQIVALVEQEIGTKVEEVHYKDMTFIDYLVEHSPGPKPLIESLKHAGVKAWEGECTASTTSEGVLRLAAPKTAPAAVFKTLLQN
ncbi:Putative exopolygalacturonase X [Verticillium dahliae VDG1]|nr:Putative exopolygalacturonase X [Verticillium dahliae VDG1]